jgi:hypothetical protein
MTKFARVVCLAAGVAAFMGVTGPAHAAPAPKATGGVTYLNEVGQGLQLEFNAQGTGSDAKGHIHFRNPITGVEFHADVDCYVQVGNQGTMSGIVTSGDKQGIYVRVVAIDNGEPGTSDIIRVTRRPDKFRCAAAPATPARNVVHGNVQIHGDAPSAAQQAAIATQSDEGPGQEEL